MTVDERAFDDLYAASFRLVAQLHAMIGDRASATLAAVVAAAAR